MVNGKSAHQARLDRDYGMVFQAPILFDWRTVQANVELPLEINGTPGPERARRAAEHLASRGTIGFRGPLSLAALGRDAATRRHRPRAGAGPGDPADGRAVRRARRDDPRAHEHGAAQDLGPDADHGPVRDPFDRRGRVPLDPGGRDVRPAGSDRRGHRHRPAARADQRHARDRAPISGSSRPFARRSATTSRAAPARATAGGWPPRACPGDESSDLDRPERRRFAGSSRARIRRARDWGPPIVAPRRPSSSSGSSPSGSSRSSSSSCRARSRSPSPGRPTCRSSSTRRATRSSRSSAGSSSERPPASWSGSITARYRSMQDSLMPFAVAASSVPILAFAPAVQQLVRPGLSSCPRR